MIVGNRLPRFNEGILTKAFVWGVRQDCFSVAALQTLSMFIVARMKLMGIGLPQTEKLGHGLWLFQPLAESHLIIETWPEDAAMVITLSTCAYRDPSKFLYCLREILDPSGDHLETLGGSDGYFPYPGKS